MKMRLANWYGEQACVHYERWQRTNDENALRDYCRFASMADRMWKSLSSRKK